MNDKIKKFSITDIKSHLCGLGIRDFNHYIVYGFRKYDLNGGVVYELNSIGLRHFNKTTPIYSTNYHFRKLHIKSNILWNMFLEKFTNSDSEIEYLHGNISKVHQYFITHRTTANNLPYDLRNFFEFLQKITQEENSIIENIDDINKL
jgi:hypothetical protein